MSGAVVHTLRVAIESLSAVTLATRDMARSVRFYLAAGFLLRYGGPDASFTSFEAGRSYLNLVLDTSSPNWGWWGRAIFYVDDVDATYERIRAAGYTAEAPPRDAEWGERYFHVLDPDGHEISFARPLRRRD